MRLRRGENWLAVAYVQREDTSGMGEGPAGLRAKEESACCIPSQSSNPLRALHLFPRRFLLGMVPSQIRLHANRMAGAACRSIQIQYAQSNLAFWRLLATL